MATAIKDNRDGRIFIEQNEGMIRGFETIEGRGKMADLKKQFPNATVLANNKKFIDTDELDDCGF